MILDELKSWTNVVIIDGQEFDSVEDAKKFDFESISADSSILLSHNRKKSVQTSFDADFKQYKITVKQYMTKKSTPTFDFMSHWNNDVPMPLRTMVGTIEKETNGMYYMRLHGDTDGSPVMHCMKCGKEITNPISQFFGLGPECGQHHYVNPFESEEELQAVVDNYRRNYLNKITWEGWVIKSAITEMEVIE